eukprot:scaffold23767_cov62-Phaeocystis_antarctica.AAC.4
MAFSPSPPSAPTARSLRQRTGAETRSCSPTDSAIRTVTRRRSWTMPIWNGGCNHMEWAV